MSSATSLSLLSLSLAAEQSQPLPAPQSNISTPDISTSASRVKPRRLSSASQMRRRMSDAREATIRPALTQSSMSGLSSAAAALSLSPKQSQYAGPTNDARSKDSVTSPTSAPNANYIASGMPAPMPPSNVGKIISHADGLQSINGVPSVGALEERVITGGGKKKGTIFRCESCSKVYRHPSCLVKHRWEHSPHWREASKFLLSKHQQVQLLEVRNSTLLFCLTLLCIAVLPFLGPQENFRTFPRHRDHAVYDRICNLGAG
ncbi:hypothetical protein SISSUDRAFT_133673 [Sistotremastrum suecicum HHB10207 ss-3]|uniref:C2H2-type domain-containing protein n=1 Tax=Sistotremastrum suecicum HHB10207 ss-3 TaxID=1314776 RepID=A0A166AW81_9AGAM|nr:hypothetical protein SISSUDRAFT_133673 [Sistotremastrum suecicum HHB10207 ss-3]